MTGLEKIEKRRQTPHGIDTYFEHRVHWREPSGIIGSSSIEEREWNALVVGGQIRLVPVGAGALPYGSIQGSVASEFFVLCVELAVLASYALYFYFRWWKRRGVLGDAVS